MLLSQRMKKHKTSPKTRILQLLAPFLSHWRESAVGWQNAFLWLKNLQSSAKCRVTLTRIDPDPETDGCDHVVRRFSRLVFVLVFFRLRDLQRLLAYQAAVVSSLMNSERERENLLCRAGELYNPGKAREISRDATFCANILSGFCFWTLSWETLRRFHLFQKTHNASQFQNSGRMLRSHSHLHAILNTMRDTVVSGLFTLYLSLQNIALRRFSTPLSVPNPENDSH